MAEFLRQIKLCVLRTLNVHNTLQNSMKRVLINLCVFLCFFTHHRYKIGLLLFKIKKNLMKLHDYFLSFPSPAKSK